MNWGQSVGRMSVKRNKVLKIGISLVTTAMMVIGTLSGIPMHAYAATDYDLWVGGVRFTDSNIVIDSEDNAAFSGTATYDLDSNTLTLSNFNNAGRTINTYGECNGILYNGSDDLTICIEGQNTISTSSASADGFMGRYGIHSSEQSANITIIGTSFDDSLDVSSGNNTYYYQNGNYDTVGIEVAGNLLIKDCSVNAVAGNAPCVVAGIIVWHPSRSFFI